MVPITVLCTTRAEPHVWPFLADMLAVARRCGGEFVVVADGPEAWDRMNEGPVAPDTVYSVQDSVHQTAARILPHCQGEYVFFLDDDERATSTLAAWCVEQQYRAADFWNIPRAWLWQDTAHYISSSKHWPNCATRIGRRSLVTIPTVIHQGWIAGSGSRRTSPYAIEHHKFLIRSLSDRKAMVKRYEAIKPGAGMPEQYLPECMMIDVAEWPHGAAV